MNSRLIITLLCAGAVAYACVGPRSHAEAPVALASALPVKSALASSRITRNSKAKAEVKLVTQFDVQTHGRNTEFALTIKNVGNKHAELDFANGQRYDFVVTDSAGHEVWQWSTGHLFTQTVQNKQLGSGESMRVSETWKKGAIAPGKYTVVATLKSSNYPTEQRAEFVLP
jgi:plastocyanin